MEGSGLFIGMMLLIMVLVPVIGSHYSYTEREERDRQATVCEENNGIILNEKRKGKYICIRNELIIK